MSQASQTLAELVARLNACRSTGQWQQIAERAGCHYFTISKIVRGVNTNPTIQLVSRLNEAIDEVVAKAPVSSEAV